MDTISPVVKGLEGYEIRLGGEDNGQESNTEIAVLRSPEGLVISRWTFTEEERQAIAAGEDLFVTQLTFNNPLQALKIEVGQSERPEKIKRQMRLEDAYELASLVRDFGKKAEAAHKRQVQLVRNDKELNDLAEQAERAKKKLARKQEEVYSEKKPSLVLTQ